MQRDQLKSGLSKPGPQSLMTWVNWCKKETNLNARKKARFKSFLNSPSGFSTWIVNITPCPLMAHFVFISKFMNAMLSM